MKPENNMKHKYLTAYLVYDAKLTFPNIKEPLMNYCISKEKTPYRVSGKLVKTEFTTASIDSWIKKVLDERIKIYQIRFTKYRVSTLIKEVEDGIFFGFLITSPGWASLSRIHFLTSSQCHKVKRLAHLQKTEDDAKETFETYREKNEVAAVEWWEKWNDENYEKIVMERRKLERYLTRKSSISITPLWHQLYDFYAELWKLNVKVKKFRKNRKINVHFIGTA